MKTPAAPGAVSADRGLTLLIQSLKQVAGILAVSYVLLMLADHGFLGPQGFRFACIGMMVLGVFSLRIFGEIAWVSLRKPNANS